MPPKSSYSLCHKCGNNCTGRYKDEQDNPLCSSCTTEHKRLYACNTCGGAHYTPDDGTCTKRKQDDQTKQATRRCTTCNKAMRTTLESMTECMTCTGKPKYWRLLRASKKQTI